MKNEFTIFLYKKISMKNDPLKIPTYCLKISRKFPVIDFTEVNKQPTSLTKNATISYHAELVQRSPRAVSQW